MLTDFLEDNFLLALYGHNYQPNSQLSAYYLIAFYDQNGKIENNAFQEIYSSLFANSIDDSLYLGPFDNLDFLKKYLLKVTNKLGHRVLYCLSLEEYNQLVLQSEDLNQFKENFLAKVSKLEVVKSGFFTRKDIFPSV